MKRLFVIFMSVILILTATNFIVYAGSESGTLKVGALLSYSGHGAVEAPSIERAFNYALNKVGGQINGLKIILLREDETDNPAQCIAKVKKFMDQDKVDVIIGPVNGQNVPAVDNYLGPLGVPHVSYTEGGTDEVKYGFYWMGNLMINAGASGIYAYDELKARKAAIIYQNFNYGQYIRDAFKATFTAKGGTIISEQGVPFGTMDMAAYLTGAKNADVICVLLVAPTDVSFVRQYREFGIKVPAIFGEAFPQGSSDYLNKQAGDAIIGMYGVLPWSPLIDTPENKKFVQDIMAKAGDQILPSFTTFGQYTTVDVVLQAVRTIKGDINRASIKKALSNLSFQTLIGTGQIQDRIGNFGTYVVQAGRVDKDNITWKPIKYYPAKP